MFSVFLLIFVVLLFLITTILWYASFPKDLPPGPWGLPFLGSTLDTWKNSTLYDRLFKWARKYGPLYKIYVSNHSVLVLGDWDTIQEAFVKQSDAYSGRPVLHTIFPKGVAGRGLANSEGELWKTQRRFALHALRDFGFGRPILKPKIKDEAEYLMEAFSAHKGQPLDPSPVIGNAVSIVICGLVFERRFEYEEGSRLRHCMHLIRSRLSDGDISFLTPFVLSKQVADLMVYVPTIKKLHNKNAELREFISEHAGECMKGFDVEKDEPTCYMQAFYKAKRERDDDWSFTDAQLLANVRNLFVAGSDTTTATITRFILYLACDQMLQEKLHEEIKKETGGQWLLNYADRVKLPLTRACILEAQRMANLFPVALLRRTIAPSKLSGYDIPMGTTVAPLLGAVMRDPKIYPNPNIFDPYRFLNKEKEKDGRDVFSYWMPFSVGKRFCLGESLAKMELFIAVTALFSRFRFYFPSDQPNPDLNGVMSMIRGPTPFRICAEIRSQ